MNADWPEVRLGDVVADITVGHVSSMTHEYQKGGIPFLRSQDIKPNRIEPVDLKFISPEFHERISKSSLHPGDVVVVRTGAPGTAAVIPASLPEANCADLVVIRSGPRVDPRFLAYFFNSTTGRRHVHAHSVGAVQQHFNVGAAREARIRLPAIDEQQAISHVLGALDDKSELNRRMNETLEAMARTLFKSWFVDFDPVRLKAAGRKPAGMDAATAALFPDTFARREAFEVPTGWNVTRLADAGTWLSGGTPSRSNEAYWGGDLPWVSAKSLSDAVWILDAEEHVTLAGAENGTRRVPRGSVLFIVRGMSLATELRIGLCSREVAFNQDLKAIVPNGTVRPELLVLWLREHRARILELTDEASHGTKRLQTELLENLRLTLPDPGTQHKLATPFEALLERILANEQESRTLRELRDALLPKLLSGELRVRDAARTVEQVA